jgi:hypothetical protein
MYGGYIKVGLARFTADLSDVNAATGTPSADTNGIAIPKGYRHETSHFLATKTNVADFDLYGLVEGTAANIWVRIDDVSFKKTTNESERLVGIGGYLRVASVRTDGVTSPAGVNTYWGFSEA